MRPQMLYDLLSSSSEFRKYIFRNLSCCFFHLIYLFYLRCWCVFLPFSHFLSLVPITISAMESGLISSALHRAINSSPVIFLFPLRAEQSLFFVILTFGLMLFTRVMTHVWVRPLSAITLFSASFTLNMVTSC